MTAERVLCEALARFRADCPFGSVQTRIASADGWFGAHAEIRADYRDTAPLAVADYVVGSFDALPLAVASATVLALRYAGYVDEPYSQRLAPARHAEQRDHHADRAAIARHNHTLTAQSIGAVSAQTETAPIDALAPADDRDTVARLRADIAKQVRFVVSDKPHARESTENGDPWKCWAEVQPGTFCAGTLTDGRTPEQAAKALNRARGIVGDALPGHAVLCLTHLTDYVQAYRSLTGAGNDGDKPAQPDA